MMAHVTVMFIAGMVAGIVFCAIGVIYAARNYMIVSHESAFGFDETIERINKAVDKADGWTSPIAEWPFYDSMLKHGKKFANVDKLVVYFLCKAEYAKDMIEAAPFMASMMPCGWAVYEQKGRTYIGTMNIGMMAMCFGGTQKKVFNAVAREEHEMLEQILK